MLWAHLGSSFKNLEHVRLDVYGSDGSSSSEALSEKDLEPLFHVKALKTFDLAVWRDNDGIDASTVSAPLQAFVRHGICRWTRGERG